MNKILETIESVDSFDELGNLMQSKDLIKQVHNFLINSKFGVKSDKKQIFLE